MVSKNIIINKKYLNDMSDIQIDNNIIKKIDKFKINLIIKSLTIISTIIVGYLSF